MLHKVFNMFVNIPENVAINIPGLRDASSLPHFKKVRQKIKNKLKIAKEQLKHQQEMSKKVESCTVSNDISVINNKIKNVNGIPVNSSYEKYKLLPEKILDPNDLNKNYVEDFNLKSQINKSNQNSPYTELICNEDDYINNKLLKHSDINKILNNEVHKSNQIHIQPTSSDLPSIIQSRLKNSTSTMTSSNINSEGNEVIDCYENHDLYEQKLNSNNQIMNKSED